LRTLIAIFSATTGPLPSWRALDLRRCGYGVRRRRAMTGIPFSVVIRHTTIVAVLGSWRCQRSTLLSFSQPSSTSQQDPPCTTTQRVEHATRSKARPMSVSLWIHAPSHRKQDSTAHELLCVCASGRKRVFQTESQQFRWMNERAVSATGLRKLRKLHLRRSAASKGIPKRDTVGADRGW
jgi:hypothetical protein